MGSRTFHARRREAGRIERRIEHDVLEANGGAVAAAFAHGDRLGSGLLARWSVISLNGLAASASEANTTVS
jgi:hypothetical protein